MKLAGADLNSLQIFFAVVEANGIANARRCGCGHFR